MTEEGRLTVFSGETGKGGEARAAVHSPLLVDLRNSCPYSQRVSSDYRDRGYWVMRKTQQLHLAGVVLLFPVIEHPLGHTVGKGEREGFQSFRQPDTGF